MIVFSAYKPGPLGNSGLPFLTTVHRERGTLTCDDVAITTQKKTMKSHGHDYTDPHSTIKRIKFTASRKLESGAAHVTLLSQLYKTLTSTQTALHAPSASLEFRYPPQPKTQKHNTKPKALSTEARTRRRFCNARLLHSLSRLFLPLSASS